MTIDLTQSELRLLRSAVSSYLGEVGEQGETPLKLKGLLEKLPTAGAKPVRSAQPVTAVESL